MAAAIYSKKQRTTDEVHLVGMSPIVQHVEIEVCSSTRERKNCQNFVGMSKKKKANLTHCPTSNNGTRQLDNKRMVGNKIQT